MSRSVRYPIPGSIPSAEYQTGKLDFSVAPFIKNIYNSPFPSSKKRDEPPTGKIDFRNVKKYTVAEIAPLNIPLGHNGYSAIETILTNIAEELHAIPNYLFNPIVLCPQGSSIANAHQTVKPIGKIKDVHDRKQHEEDYDRHFRTLEEISNIDIIHNHTGEFAEWVAKNTTRVKAPIVHTVHVSYEKEQLDTIRHQNSFYVAISKAHKRDLEKTGLSVSKIIYNGIRLEDCIYEEKKEDFMLAIGRITQDKGFDHAIAAAQKAGKKLVIAGPVQDKEKDRVYFENKIQPHIQQYIPFEEDPHKGLSEIIQSKKNIIYLGEIGRSKYQLFSKAQAMLFPIQWEEPFGMVMVESMASGTPVIAYNRASVPEIVKNKVSGFIVDNNVEALASALQKVHYLTPADCRARAQYFSSKRMAADYADFFQEILDSKSKK